VFAGLVPSSQTVGFLLITLWLAKPVGKIAKLHINDTIWHGKIFYSARP